MAGRGECRAFAPRRDAPRRRAVHHRGHGARQRAREREAWQAPRRDRAAEQRARLAQEAAECFRLARASARLRRARLAGVGSARVCRRRAAAGAVWHRRVRVGGARRFGHCEGDWGQAARHAARPRHTPGRRRRGAGAVADAASAAGRAAARVAVRAAQSAQRRHPSCHARLGRRGRLGKHRDDQ